LESLRATKSAKAVGGAMLIAMTRREMTGETNKENFRARGKLRRRTKVKVLLKLQGFYDCKAGGHIVEGGRGNGCSVAENWTDADTLNN